MRFALLGNHPDGLAMAQALVEFGKHELAVVADVDAPDFAPMARRYPDLEEVLADPAIELVIVAGPLSIRAQQLRRAVQSERDVLCVHPCDERVDIAYEAALIQAETKRLLLPLLPAVLHPVFARLREVLSDGLPLRLLQWRRASEHVDVFEIGWSVLRRLGGEIVEVSGMAPAEEVNPAQPILVSGRFQGGGLFQVTWVSGMSEAQSRLAVFGSKPIMEICGPEADHSALLRIGRTESDGTAEVFEHIHPWQLLAKTVDSLRADPTQAGALSWQDEIRELELHDALKRSIEKQRTSSLEYQEVSEEVGNKGTLTLIGCGMIWLVLLIFGLSIWAPPIRWAIVPLLLGYMILLAMNWLARGK